jgi:hypothetical protein
LCWYLTMDDHAFQQKYGDQRRLPPGGHGGSQNAQNITLNMPAQGQGQGASVSDELQKLGELRNSGVLTEAEFQAQKQKLLQ